jgi:hypothetical protein
MARTNSITSANAVLLLSVPGIFNVGQLIQGFASDDAFDIDPVESAETMMGVDGIFSAGWIPKEKKQNVTLQADSRSVFFFDQWYAASQAVREVYKGSGVIISEALGVKYQLDNGVLSSYSYLAPHKKVAQPRKFIITWGRISVSRI